MELSEKNIADMLEDIPTFSTSVLRILELTADIECPTKDLVRHITHDPILTARVLKLVNSSYFGLSRKVTSIQQSVIYVGVNTIKNLSVSVAAMGSLPPSNGAGLDMDDFWLHSLVTAVVAKILAQKNNIPPTQVSTYFISALLHDIGQIIFSQVHPTTYQKVIQEARKGVAPIEDIEQEIFGINHAELGALLAEKWMFSEDMVNAIRYHHNPDQLGDEQILNRIVFVANQAAKTLVEDDKKISNTVEISPTIVKWLGASIEEVAAHLPNVEEEIESAKVFLQFSS